MIKLALILFGFALQAQEAPHLYAPADPAVQPEKMIKNIFPGAASEYVTGLKKVRALKIDIPLAQRDFPCMKTWPIGRIYGFFERVGGIVSLPQAQQQIVNTEIETDGSRRLVYRPPGYGRAVVVEFDEDGCRGAIEVKMSGVGTGKIPSHAAHSDGLGTLGEVIREDEFENAIRASVEYAKEHDLLDANSQIGGTVAGYGVMYAGYYVKHADGSTSPAGIYLRQAHHRLNYTDDVRAAWLPAGTKNEILRLISRFGFYTGWESNIQGLIKNGKVYLFDFGHWIAWQGLVQESGTYVDPALAVDFNTWGWDPNNGPRRDMDQWRTSKLDRPWNWAHDTAKAATGAKGQQSIIHHFNDMLEPFLRKLNVGIGPATCGDSLFTK